MSDRKIPLKWVISKIQTNPGLDVCEDDT